MRIAVALILIALALPELPRYRGERRLGGLTGFMNLIQSRDDLAQHRRAALLRVSVEAERTHTFPGDWRPLMLAGNASLLAGDHTRAAELFTRALEQGERPEVLASLGLALLAAGDQQRAKTLFARAVRISPGLTPWIVQRTGIPASDFSAAPLPAP